MKKKEFHGLTKHPLYSVWDAMRQRCINPKHNRYNSYGGRGISVCYEWMNSFKTFYDWAIKNGYRKGLTIERKKVNGNYNPSNCTWVTLKDQANNKQNTIYIEHNGETKSLKEWCNILGLNYRMIDNRIHVHGWPLDKVLVLKKHQRLEKPKGRKLSESDVLNIRKLFLLNTPTKEIADMFSITRQYVNEILRGEKRA